ncbi:MAG TPA: thioredoxin family protein [Bacteroidales bacterium]|nr:thioredoxin family protein [Bacteroidales bacterium]HRX95763.1 thioredoxin family protein [Bacteroidales bacterium]
MKLKVNLLMIALTLSIVSGRLFAQSEQPYDPALDGHKQINDAVAKAKAKDKHVFLMIGGNWCKWCMSFHKFIHENAAIDSTLHADYVFVLLNYSRENKNLDILADLDYPQRFGFPVFVILDADGNRIHTQNSAYVEKGEGYDEKKVLDFLKHWSPAAIDPENY